jgi:hypothetical protein
MLSERERDGLDADHVRLHVRDQTGALQLLVDLQVAVVDGEVVTVVEDDLQLGRYVVRLQDLEGDLVERLVVDAIDRVAVQRRVGVADAVRRDVDLACARLIEVTTRMISAVVAQSRRSHTAQRLLSWFVSGSTDRASR